MRVLAGLQLVKIPGPNVISTGNPSGTSSRTAKRFHEERRNGPTAARKLTAIMTTRQQHDPRIAPHEVLTRSAGAHQDSRSSSSV